MFRPKFYITITKDDGTFIEFPFCTEFETQEGFEFLTNTAKVTLPRKLTQNGLPLFTGADPIFKRKDKIKIEAGYFPNRETVFIGFISHVSANVPVKLECEDYMFIFKQYKVTYPKQVAVRTFSKKGKPLKYPKITSKNIKLSELIQNIFHEGEYNDLLNGITYAVDSNSDIELGEVSFSNASPAEIFDKLKDTCGITCKMVGTVLRVGLAYNALDTKTGEFILEEVGINSNELEYQRAEDVNIRVKVISILQNNRRIEVEAGDSDGEQRTYHKNNITSKTDLQKVADGLVNKAKYTGFRGYFETFGEPYMRTGDAVKLVSKKLPERNGTYLIKSVRRIGGVEQGYKQNIELGALIGR